MQATGIDAAKRNYGLDIARASAIILVLLAHLIQKIIAPKMPGVWYIAFLGVDIFFALSGFLIGHLLINIFHSPNPGFGMVRLFLVRRWLRTVPLYWIMLLVNFLVFRLIYTPAIRFDYHYLLWAHNLFQPVKSFFGESWSLSIEEWFYLLFAIGLFLFIKAASYLKLSIKYALLLFTLAHIGFFTLLRLSLAGYDYLEETVVIFRLDAIAYGVLLAILQHSFPACLKYLNLAAGVSLSLTGTVLSLFRSQIGGAYMLYYTFTGIGLAIIIFNLQLLSPKLQKSFYFKAVTLLSKISYSIYLVNVLIIRLALYAFKPNSYTSKALLAFGCFCVTIAVSLLTYHLIEKPFLQYRNKQFPQ